MKVKVKYASWVAQKSNTKMKSIDCEKRKHRRRHRGVVFKLNKFIIDFKHVYTPKKSIGNPPRNVLKMQAEDG